MGSGPFLRLPRLFLGSGFRVWGLGARNLGSGLGAWILKTKAWEWPMDRNQRISLVKPQPAKTGTL